MKHFTYYSVKLYFIVFLVAWCYGGGNSKGRSKSSTYGAVIPFLRTGRAGIDLIWGGENEPRGDYKRTPKLVAFPRVGRGGHKGWTSEESLSQKRSSNNNGMSTGMWFGPRLGRLQKRQIYQENPWGYLAYEERPREVVYTPRLGRESQEIFEDDKSEESP